MSDYNDETAFLRRLLSYDESFESKNVEQMIARLQRDRACVLKAAWTMGLLAVLSSIISQSEFFQSGSPMRLRVVCVAGLAALICFSAFAVMLVIYRARLNGLRDKCRGLIGKLVETQVTRSMNLLVLPGTAGSDTSTQSGK
jgi:hypothetical protein